MNNKPKIETPSRNTEPSLARGLRVFLVGSYIQNPKTVVIIETYNFKNAVRVRDGAGVESIITTHDIVTSNELDALRAEIDKKKSEEFSKRMAAKYSDVVEMWSKGLRTGKEMADSFTPPYEHPIAFFSRIRAAKKLGLIKESAPS